MVALAKQEELQKFEKLKVYEVVKEEEFRNDPRAIKIGTKWVITNKGTKTKPMIKARFVGKEFADDTKKGELFAGTPGLPALRYLVSKLATSQSRRSSFQCCSNGREECVSVRSGAASYIH